MQRRTWHHTLLVCGIWAWLTYIATTSSPAFGTPATALPIRRSVNSSPSVPRQAASSFRFSLLSRRTVSGICVGVRTSSVTAAPCGGWQS